MKQADLLDYQEKYQSINYRSDSHKLLDKTGNMKDHVSLSILDCVTWLPASSHHYFFPSLSCHVITFLCSTNKWASMSLRREKRQWCRDEWSREFRISSHLRRPSLFWGGKGSNSKDTLDTVSHLIFVHLSLFCFCCINWQKTATAFPEIGININMKVMKDTRTS